MRNQAVSEAVGAFVLVAIGVLAMTIFALVFFATPLPTKVPSFSGLISNKSNTIYISHEGGDPLLRGQYKILVDNVDETLNFTKSLPDANRTFSVGMVMNATLPRVARKVIMVFNTSWGGETVLLSADLVRQNPQAPYGWYNGDWLYREKITIDHTKVPSDLSNFPVLISLADPDLNDPNVRTDGYDLLFTDSTGMNKLSHEIELFTWNSGTLVAWVKVPALSSTTDTVIYLYYGNLGAARQDDPTGVWDADFKGVWHLNDDPSISTDGACGGGTKEVCESTGNHADGDMLGAMTAGDLVATKIDGGYDMDGSDDAVDTTDAPFDFTGDFTLSAWVDRAAGGATSHHPLSKRGANGSGGFSIAVGNLGEVYCQTDNGAGVINSYTAQGVVTAAAGWQFVVAIRTGTTCRVYVNNVDLTTNFGNHAVLATNNLPLRLGENGNGVDPWLGDIDEIRVSDIARPLNWMTTEYNNENNPGVGGFLTSVSIEQTPKTMT